MSGYSMRDPYDMTAREQALADAIADGLCICGPDAFAKDCEVHGALVEPANDEPYEPVCDTCRGDQSVLVYSGRGGQQSMPCPRCILKIPEAD